MKSPLVWLLGQEAALSAMKPQKQGEQVGGYRTALLSTLLLV